MHVFTHAFDYIALGILIAMMPAAISVARRVRLIVYPAVYPGAVFAP